ncbi:hypothetical protein BKA83DRAFT_4122533 [Pisolithus microcarpus]|nr:hypothetical protein BKA83DRAFT_4122533 [Pisolithus microcarpus]
MHDPSIVSGKLQSMLLNGKKIIIKQHLQDIPGFTAVNPNMEWWYGISWGRNTSFTEYPTDLVQGKEADEVIDAYHWVISRGIISDTHNLLLSQMEAMKKLPYDVMAKVDARTIKLRSLSRDRNPNLQQEESAFLMPPNTLPKLERHSISRCVPLTNTTVHNMLASPSTLVGKRFILQDVDVYYCTGSFPATCFECEATY